MKKSCSKLVVWAATDRSVYGAYQLKVQDHSRVRPTGGIYSVAATLVSLPATGHASALPEPHKPNMLAGIGSWQEWVAKSGAGRAR